MSNLSFLWLSDNSFIIGHEGSLFFLALGRFSKAASFNISVIFPSLWLDRLVQLAGKGSASMFSMDLVTDF